MTKMHHLLILDSSGSMRGVCQETINGVNEQLAVIKQNQEQYESDQEHFISLVVFGSAEDRIVYKIWKKPCNEVEDITTETYIPFGSTPLFDAIGMGIQGLRNEIKEDLEDDTTRLSVAIFTDGQENSSEEFTGEDVSALVQELQDTNRWLITFVGCDDNVFEVAASMNISRGNTMRYSRGIEGTTAAFTRMSETYTKMSHSVNENTFDNLSISGVYNDEEEENDDE